MTCPKCGEALIPVANVLGQQKFVHYGSEGTACGKTKKLGK